MASIVTNRGALVIASHDVEAIVHRILAVDTAPASDAAARDLNTVADVIGDEITGAGYARATAANVTVTENDSSDAAIVSADMPVALGSIVVGETIAGVWVFQRVTGGDLNTDPLIAWIDTNNLPTNGAAVQLNQSGGELYRLSTI